MRHRDSLLLLLSLSFAPFAVAAASPADREIEFWQQRVARDPEDFISPVRLSAAYLSKARESGDAACYVKAAELAQHVLDKDPANYGANLNRAQACIAMHRFNDALRLAAAAAKVDPTKPDAYAVLFDAQFAGGDIDGAEKSCLKLFEISPRIGALTRRANLHYIKGENEKAIEDFKSALELTEAGNTPAETLAWIRVQIGAIYFGQGDVKNAEEFYLAALNKAPESYATMDRVAELRAVQGNFTEAVALYTEALNRAPNDAHLFQALGDLYKLMEKPEDAKAWHLKALAIYKKSVEQGDVHYLRHLALYYADSGENLANAVKYARLDLENRKDVFAYDVLAWALYRNGDVAAAADAIRKALALGTRDAHLYYHAGIIFSRTDQFLKGQGYIRQAYTTNAHFQKFHAHR
jgi:tetratricopeptide (TPR) repeat protein